MDVTAATSLAVSPMTGPRPRTIGRWVAAMSASSNTGRAEANAAVDKHTDLKRRDRPAILILGRRWLSAACGTAVGSQLVPGCRSPTELLAVGEPLGDYSIGAPDAMGCWALELGGHGQCDARRRPSPESVKTCRGRSHPTWNVSTQLFTM